MIKAWVRDKATCVLVTVVFTSDNIQVKNYNLIKSQELNSFVSLAREHSKPTWRDKFINVKPVFVKLPNFSLEL